MSFGGYILVVSLEFLIAFFPIRGYVADVYETALNRSNQRKRRKGQNFFEWLFCVRFLDVIPKRHIIWLHSQPIIYLLVICSFTLLHIMHIGDLPFKEILILYEVYVFLPLLLVRINYKFTKKSERHKNGYKIVRNKRKR